MYYQDGEWHSEEPYKAYEHSDYGYRDYGSACGYGIDLTVVESIKNKVYGTGNEPSVHPQ